MNYESRIKPFIIVFLALFILHYSLFSSPIFATGTCPNTITNTIQFDQGLLTEANINDVNKYYGGLSSACIIEERGAIPQFSFPTFDVMKALYYDQAKGEKPPLTSGDKTQNDIQLDNTQSSTAKDRIYYINGNLTTSGNIPGSSGNHKAGVIFVSGDMLIKNSLTDPSTSSGIVFIVKGNLYIDESVTQVDAFLVAHTSFCSSSRGDLPSVSCLSQGADIRRPLVINGSVIFLNPALTPTPAKPQFVRTNPDSTLASETINYQAKYLIILKDIFAKDLSIWSEVQ